MARAVPAIDKLRRQPRLFDDAMAAGRSERIDPAEWVGRLYDRYADGLYRYALVILADGESAADVIQQVFTALVALRKPIECEERYLRRAVRNECFSQLRARRHRSARPDEKAALFEPFDSGIDPAERLAIEQAVRALPPDQREVIHLKIWDGMTFHEIADLTGESMNTIASRYRYAIAKIRTSLGSPRP